MEDRKKTTGKRSDGVGCEIEAIRPESWERGRLREVLRRHMPEKRILVVGDVGVDRYTSGRVERISPEAPVPILLVESEQLKLGLAANVADNVRALGGVPLLVGLTGRDRTAQDFRQLLSELKIAPRYLVADASRRTVLKERIVSERQQLLRVDYETVGSPLPPAVSRAVLSQVRSLLKISDFLILEDYHKGLFSPELGAELFEAARRAGKRVAVDPNARTPLSWYRGAFLLTPNTREAEALSGIPIVDSPSLARAGIAILKATGAAHVVVTRGKDGMAIFTAGSKSIQIIPTYAREVYDVSGAGDTVISVLALALAGGATIEEATVLGNLAAGVEVGKRGTATVSPEEVEQALEQFGASMPAPGRLPASH